MEWTTTSTILERLRDHGDDAMWRAFVDRFRRPVVAFARRFGLLPAEAEDAAQEILIAFAEGHRQGKYDPAKGRLSSWLFGIAYRHLANVRRRGARERERFDPRGGEPAFFNEISGQQEVSAAWDVEWERAVLEACLRQVRGEVEPDTFRAFDLVVNRGRSPQEAATELEIKRETVYLAKHRVLKRLRELAATYEGSSPAA